MANENCLEGIRCPKCGHEDDFYVRAECDVLLTDEGTEETSNRGGYEWDENSPCECLACGYRDIMDEFNIDTQERRAKDAQANQSGESSNR